MKLLDEAKIWLFDLDDTLLDTSLYKKLYLPLLEDIKKRKKISDNELNAAIDAVRESTKRGRADLSVDSYELCNYLNCLDLYYELLEKWVKKEPHIDKNVEQIFKILKDKKKIIGVVSGSHRRTVELHLNLNKLSKYVGIIWSCEEGGKKADLEFWENLVKNNKLNSKECIMVGDHYERDVLLAKKVGFKSILIGTGFFNDKTKGSEYDFFFKDLKELNMLLQK